MPSLADAQASLSNGFYVAEGASGINGATADIIGNAVTLGGCSLSNVTLPSFAQSFQAYLVQLRTTGTFTAGKLTVEGSLDGTNWTELGISNATSAAAVPAGGFAFTTAATTLFTNTIDMPLRYIRARLSGSTASGTGAFVSIFVGGF